MKEFFDNNQTKRYLQSHLDQQQSQKNEKKIIKIILTTKQPTTIKIIFKQQAHNMLQMTYSITTENYNE